MKKTVDIFSGRRIVELVNVLEPLRQSPSPRFASFAITGRWFQHRRRKSRAFAFQGRRFVCGERAMLTPPFNDAAKAKPEISAGRHTQSAVLPSGRGDTSKRPNVVGAPTKAMALCEPRRQRPCRRDRNEQARRPIYPSGPRNGRLEVECERSAGGSPQQSGDGREEPSGASGLAIPPEILTKGKAMEDTNGGRCGKCGGEMKPGKAMGQTAVALRPSRGPNDMRTYYAGGTGKLIDCLKCESCGRSVTFGAAAPVDQR